MKRHNSTSKHINLSERSGRKSPSHQPDELAEDVGITADEEQAEANVAESEPIAEEESKNDPAFLDELSNQNWSSPNPPETSKPKPKGKENKFVDVEIADLYDDKPSGIVGQHRRRLLTKISEYKKSFPEILGKFRIKKNATEEELQEYLEECISISEMDSVSQFVSTIAMFVLNGAEKLSARTKFNVTGLTIALQANDEFNKCMKQLCLKHSTFASVPPEGRMLIIIMATAWMIVGKNAQMAAMQPMPDAHPMPM